MALKIRNISMQEEVLKVADKEADRLGLSFSAFVRLLLNQYFDDIRFERRRDEATPEPTAVARAEDHE